MNPIDRMMQNPHYRSGAVTARFCAAAATLMWGSYTGIDGLDGMVDGIGIAPYPMMIQVMPLSVWAAIAAALAVIQLVRLYQHAVPRWWGTVINGLFAFFWLFVALSRITFSGPGTASITIIAWMALCAFISNPVRGHD
jgi:hypothetical protein